MKRVILVISILILTAVAFNEIVYGVILGGRKNDAQLLNSVSNKLIRFHVLANSDSAEDQSLKLKVKDEVLKVIAPELEKCGNIEESREILKKNDARIKKLAEKIIKENGYDYKVNTSLSKENFPVKSYGAVTLPQGSYEAYRILIGDAGGQNWWCVMFPPLCFIDITKGEVAEKETGEEMRRVLDEEEFNFVNNDGTNVELKFKAIEIYDDIKSYILGE